MFPSMEGVGMCGGDRVPRKAVAKPGKLESSLIGSRARPQNRAIAVGKILASADTEVRWCVESCYLLPSISAWRIAWGS